MSPLVGPCPRFSYKSESSITTTKPIARLQRAQNNIDGEDRPRVIIRDTDSLVRTWYLQANVAARSPGESALTQTLAGSELAAPYRTARAHAITQVSPNSYGMSTPQPTPHLSSMTQETLTITRVIPNGNWPNDDPVLNEVSVGPGIVRPASVAVADAPKAFTSVLITATFVTSGVLTTTSTSNLPNGSTEVFALAPSGTRTTTTTVPTQTGTTSLSNGLRGIIGGIVGATVIVILALVVFCILRCKRRRLVTSVSESCSPTAPISQSPQPLQITETSDTVIPFPFLSPTPIARDNAVTVRRGGKEQILPSPLECNQENVGDNRDPFQDPEILDEDISHQRVQSTRDALDRLQQLTNQLETELQQLSDLARSGQLSEGERTRLEEIRRTAGLTMPFDRGSVSSSEASYSTAPPSYRSGLSNP
ncbi:hypothetical protein P691DRAFT_807362 [Macrolepiota fuliginosa MF-IS2]|uniref:Uncharacterized protein n=1 Tax=Macrolepiota fuliginosa MF-IS2 TaxID=1400762 RepID=A0A9P5X7W9_9AGAR|nr:hypothetical protein P691DRAFT_807362 [Macrolepiota fuliginosa MF-IS2]